MGSQIVSTPDVKQSATGTFKAGGCLSFTLRVIGAGTTFVLYGGAVTLTDLDAPINFPYYENRKDSRRWDEIQFERTVGTGSLVAIKDQDLTCQN